MKTVEFRDYHIHIHEQLSVFIGNDNQDLIVYDNRENYACQLMIRWNEQSESLRIINRWRFTFEIDGYDNYVHYDPDYRY